MNKKNTKKYIKRLTNNNIILLPHDFTWVHFDNGEFPMFTEKKPLNLGREIVVKQFIRGKITGRVKSLKREKRKNYKGWKMLVAVESTDRSDCLKIGE